MELPLAPGQSEKSQNADGVAQMLERSVCHSISQLADTYCDRQSFEHFDWLHSTESHDLPLANPVDNMTGDLTLGEVAAQVNSACSLTIPTTAAEKLYQKQANWRHDAYTLLRLKSFKVPSKPDERLSSGEIQRLSARDLRPVMPAFFMAQGQEEATGGSCPLPENVALGEMPEISRQFAAMKCNWLDDPKFSFYVLREKLDGEPQIVAGAGIYSMGHIGYITDCHVLGEHRSKGLGSLLLSIALENCARALFDHVILLRPKGCPAIPFFERKGFEPTGAISTLSLTPDQ